MAYKIFRRRIWWHSPEQMVAIQSAVFLSKNSFIQPFRKFDCHAIRSIHGRIQSHAHSHIRTGSAAHTESPQGKDCGPHTCLPDHKITHMHTTKRECATKYGQIQWVKIIGSDSVECC